MRVTTRSTEPTRRRPGAAAAAPGLLTTCLERSGVGTVAVVRGAALAGTALAASLAHGIFLRRRTGVGARAAAPDSLHGPTSRVPSSHGASSSDIHVREPADTVRDPVPARPREHGRLRPALQGRVRAPRARRRPPAQAAGARPQAGGHRADARGGPPRRPGRHVPRAPRGGLRLLGLRRRPVPRQRLPGARHVRHGLPPGRRRRPVARPTWRCPRSSASWPSSPAGWCW